MSKSYMVSFVMDQKKLQWVYTNTKSQGCHEANDLITLHFRFRLLHRRSVGTPKAF